MKLDTVQYSTVSSKGLAVIPKAVRERLGLQQGDKVAFVMTADGVWIQPAAENPVARGLGLLAPARIDILAEKRAETAAEERDLPAPRRQTATRVAEQPGTYRTPQKR